MDPDQVDSLDDPLLARSHAADCADEVMKRVADLWAKLAQLDPEVAKRLPTYEA